MPGMMRIGKKSPPRRRVCSAHTCGGRLTRHTRELQGQTFMVIGTAGELPKPPTEKIVFLEDMTDSELADAVRRLATYQSRS